jgi:hypothetical protein
MALIYALTCPSCGCSRYVGQTIFTAAKREAQHLKGIKSRDSSIHKKRWVQTLLDQGLRPGFVVLLELPSAEHLDAAEVFWIAEMRARGCPLTNLTDGGGGHLGYKQRPETIEKRAAHFRGVPKSAEHKAKIAAALTGRPSQKKGRPLSPAEKVKHAAARTIPPFQDQHGRVYSTIKEAAELWGIPPGNIVHCLKGRRKSAGGLAFRYC